jgi:hypothetical protein
MDALLDIFRAMIALLASLVLSQFGVSLQSKGSSDRRPEVHRTEPVREAEAKPKTWAAPVPMAVPMDVPSDVGVKGK